MMTVNVNVTDGLYNGALGTLKRIDFTKVPGRNETTNTTVWIEFDNPKVGIDARREKRALMERNDIPNSWTPISKLKKQFNIVSGNLQVIRYQYPLVEAEARTIHKSQGLTMDTAVLDPMGERLSRKEAYTAISRARSLNGIFILNEFKFPFPPSPGDPVVSEMLRMETNCQHIPKFRHLRLRSNEFLQIISHNVQSLKAHEKSIISDRTYMNSDLILLQETWLSKNQNITIAEFNEIAKNQLNNARGRGTSIYGKESKMEIFQQFKSTETEQQNGHCEITSAVVNDEILILNIYKSSQCSQALLLQAMNNYRTEMEKFNNIILAGDFNEEIKPGSRLSNLFKEKFDLDVQKLDGPTTRSGSTIDGLFTKLRDFNLKCYTYYSYFSYHYPVVIKIYKND